VGELAAMVLLEVGLYRAHVEMRVVVGWQAKRGVAPRMIRAWCSNGQPRRPPRERS
jgi:hypothetical protein